MHPAFPPKPHTSCLPADSYPSCLHPLLRSANLACVLNGGNANGVTCFMVDPMHGLMPDGIQTRSLPVRALATPPMGPFNTYSQILFSNDGNELVIIFKGDSMNPGSIATFMVRGTACFTGIRDTLVVGGG